MLLVLPPLCVVTTVGVAPLYLRGYSGLANEHTRFNKQREKMRERLAAEDVTATPAVHKALKKEVGRLQREMANERWTVNLTAAGTGGHQHGVVVGCTYTLTAVPSMHTALLIASSALLFPVVSLSCRR